MIIAFTGPRAGFTDFQAKELLTEMGSLPYNQDITIMHGACVGSDERFHMLIGSFLHISKIVQRRLTIEVYPSNLEQYRSSSGMTWYPGTELIIHRELPPKERNVIMAQRCNRLWGTPTDEMRTRSGTWHTIGKVQQLFKPHVLFYPSHVQRMRC